MSEKSVNRKAREEQLHRKRMEQYQIDLDQRRERERREAIERKIQEEIKRLSSENDSADESRKPDIEQDKYIRTEKEIEASSKRNLTFSKPKTSDDRLRDYLLSKGHLKKQTKATLENSRQKKEETKSKPELKTLRQDNTHLGSMKCYVYGSNRINRCRKCGNKDLALVAIQYSPRVKVFYNVRLCPECNIYYLPYKAYIQHSKDWYVLNSSELVGMAGAKKETKNYSSGKVLNPGGNSERSYDTEPYFITAHDFVVRQNVFKCRHKGHVIRDIQAMIATINRQGDVSELTVSAGYCPDCNTYFMMDSIYNKIKHGGIPICRTMDSKSYERNDFTDSSYGNPASESVLKQFGYSVSMVDDIPSIQRKKILESIVDNKVLTKSEVISYLNYFINYRKNQKKDDGSLKYAHAISCWCEDRDWLDAYNLGKSTAVRVKRIITNK